MAQALQLAEEAASEGEIPVGCVITDENGTIIGRGHNRVLLKKQPTGHGEMEAIRDACVNVGSHDLTGCELYTTAEPCPMCLGAIMWANINKVYYGCNVNDTDKIGFRDDKFYDYLKGKGAFLTLEAAGRKECVILFKDYMKDKGAERY